MKEEETQILIKLLEEIENSVSKVKIVHTPEEIEGKVIEYTKTVNIDEQNYSEEKIYSHFLNNI